MQSQLPEGSPVNAEVGSFIVLGTDSERSIRYWRISVDKDTPLPFMVERSKEEGVVQDQIQEELVLHETFVNRIRLTITGSPDDDSVTSTRKRLRLRHPTNPPKSSTSTRQIRSIHHLSLQPLLVRISCRTSSSFRQAG